MAEGVEPMAPDDHEAIDKRAPVSAVVAMLPVKDVERSAAFYQLLGFEVGNRVPRTGTMGWAWLFSPHVPDWRRGPNLMLTRTDGALNTPGPKALFYLYASDLVALRESLIAAEQQPGPISYPDYLPKGEFPLHDPDGHLLMIAQRFEDTP